MQLYIIFFYGVFYIESHKEVNLLHTQAHILSVAPYPEFQSLVSKVSKEFSDVRFETFTGNLDYALEYMHSLPLCEYDAILSRGGTAQKLQAALNIPVFDAEVSAYDVLRAIKISSASKKKTAIVAYESIIASAQTLCRILDLNDIPLVSVTQDSVQQVLLDLSASGIQLIIGDVVSVEKTAQLGMQGILITSSADSIRKSFRAILTHINAQRHRDDESLIFRNICDLSPDSCFALDAQLRLVYANDAAKKKNFSALIDQLLRMVPTLQKEQSTFRFIQKKKENIYDILMRQIQIGNRSYYLYDIRETSNPAADQSSISYENSSDPLGPAYFLFSDGTYLKPTLQAIRHACSTQTPALIWGEVGTEKASVVRYIHRNGLFNSSPMLRFDCRSLTEKQWMECVENPNSILNSAGCTIYFDHIHMLSPAFQSQIYTFLDNTHLQKRHQVLATCVDNPSQLVLHGLLSDGLYRFFAHSIHMPSIDQRKEDIEALAALYFPRLNNEYGQQVVGFESDALPLLQSYHWSLNLETLQHALAQMVLRTDGCYITKATADQVLTELSTPVSSPSTVDLSGSLDQIEREIILQVLRDENMNQSKAAQRLNISRSTLWRKLK